jgi:hypothetical protein
MNDHPNRGVKDIPDAGDEAAVEECIEALARIIREGHDLSADQPG